MTIIETPEAMARATCNPWLRKRLALYAERLAEAGCSVGELGPVIIVEPGDTLSAIERAGGIVIGTNLVDGLAFPDPGFVPNWEACNGDHGWYEIAFVSGDDGGGAVLFVPDRDGIDPALLAIIHAFAQGEHPRSG